MKRAVAACHARARCWCVAIVLLAPGAAASGAPMDFGRDIQPILAEHCFACHGPDADARKADLRLDIESGAKAAVIVPHDASASELLRRISSTDPDVQMPPPGPSRRPLEAAEVARIRAWIDGGAPWEGHWAFQAITRPAVPTSEGPSWGANAIDAFVLARLRAEGLAPSSEAGREKLLRRVTFDLTGLPPTSGELDAFLTDAAPDAYEKVVDRLLASPRYGERMAMQWLDAARFADTNGFQGDFMRYMWPWRDWVIASFNENKPFDQFIVEQLAGDLLPEATVAQRGATGFLRNGRSVTEGGSIEEEWRIESIVERVETVGIVLLGLSTGCARCHDHKYDPFSQRDFYEFFAFLNNTAEKGYYAERPGNTGPTVHFPEPEHEKRLAELAEGVRAAEEALVQARAEADRLPEEWRALLRETPPATAVPDAALRVRLDGAVGAPIGGARAFGGDSTVAPDLGQAYPFERTAAFTLMAWVRPDAPGPLWSKMEGPPAARGIATSVLDDGRLVVTINHVAQSSAIRLISEPALEMGVWSHVAVRYDGSGKVAGLTLFLNGTPLTWIPYHDTLDGTIDTQAPLRLGAHLGNMFTGAMADFRVYATALSGEQVTAVLEGKIAATPADLAEGGGEAFAAFHAHRNRHRIRLQEAVVTNAERAREAYLEVDVPSIMVLEELPEPRPTFLLKRGAYDAPDTSEALAPAVPDFLHPFPAGAPPNRLGLAHWIVDPSNPLTARVLVNRVWQGLFGAGLVRTPDNFGMQGEPPTHPELLDWLASEFVASGWDVKGLQKALVMSATYRQDSILTAELRARDPDNRLLARASRFRMPAEFIRDNALAASGLLTPRIGGPSVMPYQPVDLWDDLASVLRGLYHEAEGEDLYRRSLYTFRKRTVPHPTLATFDAPTFDICEVKRSRTNTPLQALALLNDTTYVEAARHLGLRMLVESGPDVDDRLRYGFRLATCRWPEARELAVLRAALAGYLETYQPNPEAARAFVANGKSPVAEGANPVELAAYMGVGRVVLSLDETITRE